MVVRQEVIAPEIVQEIPEIAMAVTPIQMNQINMETNQTGACTRLCRFLSDYIYESDRKETKQRRQAFVVFGFVITYVEY